MVVRANRDSATPTGDDVVVNPVDPSTGTSPVTITFDEVTGTGTTTVTSSSRGEPPSSSLKLGSNPPTYFEVHTTATTSGPIEVCINYAGIRVNNEAHLKLSQHVDTNGDGVGDSWQDVTTSLDTVNDVICGEVTSL